MSSSEDELVERYLARLRTAASGMPADRRQDLINDVALHVAEAMAADPAPPGGVRTVLDQLGSPEEIALAAGAPPAGPSPRAGGQLGALEIVTVIALLIGGIVLPVVGWLVGVVLLWISPRWRPRDKVLGTLIWPGGLLASVVVLFVLGASTFIVASDCESNSSTAGLSQAGVTAHIPSSAGTVCSGPVIPPWLAITLAIAALLASLLGPILVAARLLRQARQTAPTTPEPDPDLLAPPLPA